MKHVWPPVVAALLILLGVELAARSGRFDPFLVQAPSAVGRAIAAGNDYALWPAALNTARGAAEGFALSALLGVTLALALGLHPLLGRAFRPYTVFFQTVPIIAVAPLLIVALGYGLPTVRASACLASIFPVIAATSHGLDSADPLLRDLFKLHRAGPLARLWKLRLPWALPSLFVGLRVAAGLATVGALVGEFVGASGGLNDVITDSRAQFRYDRVYAAVVVASLLGLALVSLVDAAARLTLARWPAAREAA